MSREQHRVHGDPQRFEVVADFIATRYGNTIRCIANVAGGKGILTRLLTKKKNFACELIDPRRTVLKGIDHRPEQFESERADYYDLLVGLHPDGALRQLEKAALIRPAVIIPCCNFWDEQRRGQYGLLTAIEDFYRQRSVQFERIDLTSKDRRISLSYPTPLEADTDANVLVTTIQFMRKWVLTVIGISLSLALGYLFLQGNRYSQLIGFFGYMGVACTLIPLPTPPYVIALGKIYDPFIVALAGAIGNCIAAFVEYHLLLWSFSKTELQQRVETNRIFQRFSYYFHRAAFVCLVFTGFTPIPFEPFRFAAILIRYNLSLYLLAVLLGRFPRYYLIALIGDQFQIPMRYLIILLLVSLTIPIIGMLIKHHSSGDKKKPTTEN